MEDQLDMDEQGQRRGMRSFTDDLPGPSPLGAMAQIAEQVEVSASARPVLVEERMERFPELRDVEVPGGYTRPVSPLQAAQQQATSEAEEDSVSKAAGKGFMNGFVGGLDTGAGVGDRFERFPELRGVSLVAGNAERFPELMANTEEAGVEQPAQDSVYDR